MKPDQIERVRASWNKVLLKSDETADLFFEKLFETSPETRDLFAEDISSQKRAHFATLNRLVGGLHEPDVMRSHMKDLFQRHVEVMSNTETHTLFEQTLLATLEQTLGDDWNQELRGDWHEAFDTVAQMVMEVAKEHAEAEAEAQAKAEQEAREAAEAEERARVEAEERERAEQEKAQREAEEAEAAEQARAEAEAKAAAEKSEEPAEAEEVESLAKKKRKRRSSGGSFGASMSAEQKKAAEAQASGPQRQLVVFDLETERYGLDIGAVREIIKLQAVTAVPRTPDFVEGVINLRGKVIPVVDLRKRFEMDLVERDEDFRIVVVDVAGDEIGMTVDAVTEVSRVPESGIEPPSSVIAADDADYLTGIAKTGEEMIILLDIGKLISVEDRRAIASSESAQALVAEDELAQQDEQMAA